MYIRFAGSADGIDSRRLGVLGAALFSLHFLELKHPPSHSVGECMATNAIWKRFPTGLSWMQSQHFDASCHIASNCWLSNPQGLGCTTYRRWSLCWNPAAWGGTWRTWGTGPILKPIWAMNLAVKMTKKIKQKIFPSDPDISVWRKSFGFDCAVARQVLQQNDPTVESGIATALGLLHKCAALHMWTAGDSECWQSKKWKHHCGLRRPSSWSFCDVGMIKVCFGMEFSGRVFGIPSQVRPEDSLSVYVPAADPITGARAWESSRFAKNKHRLRDWLQRVLRDKL